MNIKAPWFTIQVDIEDGPIVGKYNANSTMGNHPDAGIQVRVEKAEVSIGINEDGGDFDYVDVTLRGTVVNKDGSDDGRYNSRVMVIGHSELEASVAKQAYAIVKGVVA